MVIPQFLDEREPLALLLTFFSFTRKSMRWNKAKAMMMVSQVARMFFLQLTSFQNMLERHWAMRTGVCSKENPQGLPLETGNTRRKKGRSVGVKRRSDIIKRRTELNMLAWKRKRVYSFSPQQYLRRAGGVLTDCTHSCVSSALFFIYFILSTHASDGRCVVF